MLLGERGTSLHNITIILNVGSGTGCNNSLLERIRMAFHASGVDVRMRIADRFTSPESLARAALAQGDRVLVAAGGDGTISAVASALVGTEAALGVLPIGTLNHFAKDMGIPLELERAAAVIQAGKIATIDAGEVNGRTFVNNSSLGLYPSMVFERGLQERTGRGKWAALLRACITVLRRFRSVHVRLRVNGQTSVRKTPFVFIGNNEYEIEGLRVGTRTCLGSGHLSVYIAQPASRARLIWLSFIALFGRLRTAKDFEILCIEEAWIETRRRRLRISLDGEVAKLRTPLHYRILPKALRVLVP